METNIGEEHSFKQPLVQDMRCTNGPAIQDEPTEGANEQVHCSDDGIDSDVIRWVIYIAI